VQRPRLGQVLVVDVLCEPGRDRWNEEKARQEGARVRVRVRVRVRASGIDFERFFYHRPEATRRRSQRKERGNKTWPA
jgi:hypothetical protein